MVTGSKTGHMRRKLRTKCDRCGQPAPILFRVESVIVGAGFFEDICTRTNHFAIQPARIKARSRRSGFTDLDLVEMLRSPGRVHPKSLLQHRELNKPALNLY
jgi:hypothetical protein